MSSGSPTVSSGPDAVLPLSVGATGAAVEDLHQRLLRAGVDPGVEQVFDSETERSVREFQATRGIRIDGICGTQTWDALIEAGWRLGDRLLFERQPMLRGDDVAELQHRLGGLGFLDDKVDGYFGPRSRRGLEDFQRNVGVTVDGICGPATLTELVRLSAKTPSHVKAWVLERARLRGTARELANRHIVIGDLGGASALATLLDRSLIRHGARADVISHPEGSAHAQTANAVGADVYVGLVYGTESRCAFYETSGFHSEGGSRLASLVSTSLNPLIGSITVEGMRLPVLRETRMPAVLCELAPPRVVVEHAAEVVEALTAALSNWCANPLVESD